MYRVRNLALLAYALISLVILRVSRSKTDQLETILVIATGKLGDVVCTTPVLRAIRSTHPKTRILVEDTTGVNAALLAYSGLADEFVRIHDIASMRVLRSRGIDVAILTGPSFYMLVAASIARIPQIVAPRIEGGYCPQETRLYKLLSRCVTVQPFHMGTYAPRERLRMLEPFGIRADDTTKHLAYSPTAARDADALLARERIMSFACISAGAGNQIKLWPAERFAAVADHIFERWGLPIVIIGTTKDKAETDAMVAALSPSTLVVNTVGMLSLDVLKALISRALIFVSVDTGPLYIAEAFGVPTVDIVGPIDEREQPPIGERHKVAVPKREKPELHVMNARVYDAAEARRQVESIRVDDVIAEVDILLGSCKIQV